MTTLAYLVAGSLIMSAIALVGSVTLLLPPAALERALGVLVSLAAGTLLGGAFFHLIPAAASVDARAAGAWILAGFTMFLLLEQGLHWHHCRRAAAQRRAPMTILILVGDALHNFLGGLGVASTFLVNAEAGVSAWLAAAAHEVPQELGDFGVLVRGGWGRRSALTWNFASGLTFLAGALVAYVSSLRFDVTPLVLFGAGNFIYIGASDLVPEFKAQVSLRDNVESLSAFTLGLAGMWALAVCLVH
jgi:zinc and cadmium transporter